MFKRKDPAYMLIIISFCLFAVPAFSYQPQEPSSNQYQDSDKIQHNQIELTEKEKTFLQSHPVIRFGTNYRWEPHVIKKDDGTTEGFDVDLIKLINERAGTNIQIVTGPWSEIVEQAKDLKIDGLSTSAASKEREPFFNFSKPYVSVFPAFVVTANSKLKIDGIDDLAGKPIAILKGNQFFLNLLSKYPSINVIELPSEEDAIKLVVEGKADAAIVPTTSYHKHYKKFGRHITIGHVATDYPIDIVYSIRKDWPELLSIINKSLASVSPETINSLFSRWFGYSPLELRADKNKQDYPPPITFSEEEQRWLNQNHVVRVRIGHFPPLMFENDEIEGIAIDYLEKIFTRHDIRHQYISAKNVSWNDALEYMREHKVVDMVPTARITEERRKYLLFSNEYLFHPWVIFTRDDFPFISGIEDLKGKTLSVPDGSVMHALLKEEYPEINIKVNEDPNVLHKCIEQLATGVVDAYIGNLTAVTYFIQHNGYSNIKVSAPTPFGTHNQAMAIRNDWPELTSIINKTLAVITPVEHAAIRNKWMSVRYDYGISLVDVFEWILGVVFLSIIVISIIFFWNRRLSREIIQRKQAEEQIKSSLKEKDVLLREIHHRVKNNMQVTSALLNLQSKKIKDKKIVEIFKESESRLKTMALVHDKLYQSENLADIKFKDYIDDLIKNQFISYGVNKNDISVKIEIEEIFIEIDLATPCGLIITELVSNSLKYAFPKGKKGEIKIILRAVNESELELIVSDDGIGMPKDLDFESTNTFGLHIVKLLTEGQLEGKIELLREQGTQYRIRFKRRIHSM